MTKFPEGIWTDPENMSLNELERFLLTVEKWPPQVVAEYMAPL